jgi:pimeloyl-ACP methyl ester carboxylesterase
MPVAAELYYHLYQRGEGDQKPVVLIHGAGGTHLHWPPDVRRLPGYKVYAIDLPGHGKSGGRGQQSVQAYTQYILEWLEEVGLYRAALVGHSLGGAIAIDLALHHAEHVLALGLVGSGARLRVHPSILENTASETTFPAAVQRIVSSAFSEAADERLVELAAQRMAETRPSVLHGDFLACNAFDVMGSIAAISAPTLVVCGQDDELTPLRYSQYLADQILGASLEVIARAGHMVMLEQPQAVASALSGFLAQVPYQPGARGGAEGL